MCARQRNLVWSASRRKLQPATRNTQRVDQHEQPELPPVGAEPELDRQVCHSIAAPTAISAVAQRRSILIHTRRRIARPSVW